MMPFPEAELVTIDRLEVALKNRDMKLLKEGAYKLHEKYHSGYQFEHFDKLKEIYVNVMNSETVSSDIKNMLCSTINDIFLDSGMETDLTTSSYEPLSQNRVSSLTKLSYNTSNSEITTATIKETSQEENISAFDVFSAPKNESSSYAQSPFEAEEKPFQEFKMPEAKINSGIIQNDKDYTQSSLQFDIPKEVRQESVFKIEEPINTATEPFKQAETMDLPLREFENPAPQKLEEIAIFYCQDVSNEKIKNITRYRELIYNLQNEHYSINEILHLISEINLQSNTNISEVKSLIDQSKMNNHKINLITNSTSANLIGLMETGGYSYSLYEKEEDKQINLIPVFGLSNQFICSSCSETYLDKEDKINPLVLQCPKCKGAMFPNFYTANNENVQINLDYYNSALEALTTSNIWVLIHPVVRDNVMTSLILSALKLNSSVEDIYILDKDINVREDFKKRFIALKDKTNINIHFNALEDFLNSIR